MKPNINYVTVEFRMTFQRLVDKLAEIEAKLS